MHKTSKLFKLKRWLKLPEAAAYLTAALGETLEPADVLRLALDGHLKLSVRLVNHELARRAAYPSQTERGTPENPWVMSPLGVIDRGDGKGERRDILREEAVRESFMWVERMTTTVPAGEYDLPLIAAERLDVDREYEELSGGTRSDLLHLGGAFIESDATLFQLLDGHPIDEEQRRIFIEETGEEPDATFLTTQLPAGRTLIVRASALTAFLEKLAGQDDPLEKPLTQRERTNLLLVIAALADHAKIDITMPSKAAGTIASLTTLLGTRLSARAIENYIKLIPDAVERSSRP